MGKMIKLGKSEFSASKLCCFDDFVEQMESRDNAMDVAQSLQTTYKSFLDKPFLVLKPDKCHDSALVFPVEEGFLWAEQKFNNTWSKPRLLKQGDLQEIYHSLVSRQNDDRRWLQDAILVLEERSTPSLDAYADDLEFSEHGFRCPNCLQPFEGGVNLDITIEDGEIQCPTCGLWLSYRQNVMREWAVKAYTPAEAEKYRKAQKQKNKG